MFKKLKKKTKDFFAPLFKPENREKGVATTLATIATVTAIIAGISTIIWGGTKTVLLIYAVTHVETAALHIGRVIVDIIYWSGKTFLSIVYNLYGGVLASEFINKAFIKDPIVINGWQIIRSFANMLIVLSFVAVGIATILRLREYEAQKLLPTLIIVAILINFSPLICGLITDSANITMNYFLNAIKGNNAAKLFYDALYDPVKVGLPAEENVDIKLAVLWKAGDKMEHWVAWFVACIQFAVYNWVAAITFFLLALLLVIRQVALACLVMLSPLAFASYALPALKTQIWDRWWKEFLSWTFTGVAASFFIYLATRLLISGDKSALTAAGGVGNLAYLIPLAFIWIAMKIIKSTSAMGASAVLGLAAGVGGFALGKAKALGKKAFGAAGKGALMGAGAAAGKGARAGLEAVGLGGVGGKISSAVGNTMERIGLRKTGVTAQKRAGKIAEAEKGMKDMSSEELAKVATKSGGRYGAKNAESVAASKLLLKQNAFETIGAADRPRVLARLRSAGVRDETLEKADYHLGGFNEDRVRKIMDARGFDRQQAETAAVEQTLDEQIPNMSHDQLRNVDPGHFTIERVKKLTPDKIGAYQYAAQAQRDKLKDPTMQGGLTLQALNAENEVRRALAAGNQALATHYTTEANKLNALVSAIQRLP